MPSAPQFWYQEKSWQSLFLSPFERIVCFGLTFKRLLATPKKVSFPVISIGNAVMGGAGKTPTAMMLADFFKARGLNPHILTRGYKGRFKNNVLVNLSKHQFQDVGDEALLLAKHAPTWVGKDRYTSALLAIEKGANLLILDDGHQNTQLQSDCYILVVDEKQKFGNTHVFPAGPLREPLDIALNRADIIFMMNNHSGASIELQEFSQKIDIQTQTTCALPTQQVHAFCALGFPDKFKQTLVNMGYTVKKFNIFPDHHPYSEQDMERLDWSKPMLTTEKDFVKLSSFWQKKVQVVTLSLIIPKELESLMKHYF